MLTLPLRDGLGLVALLRPAVCFGTSSLVVELFLLLDGGGLDFVTSVWLLETLPRREGGKGLADLLSLIDAGSGTSSFGPKRDDSRREMGFGC